MFQREPHGLRWAAVEGGIAAIVCQVTLGWLRWPYGGLLVLAWAMSLYVRLGALRRWDHERAMERERKEYDRTGRAMDIAEREQILAALAQGGSA